MENQLTRGALLDQYIEDLERELGKVYQGDPMNHMRPMAVQEKMPVVDVAHSVG